MFWLLFLVLIGYSYYLVKVKFDYSDALWMKVGSIIEQHNIYAFREDDLTQKQGCCLGRLY